MKLTIATPEGTFTATYTPLGLASLDFPGRNAAGPRLRRAAPFPKSIRLWHVLTSEALLATLDGKAIRELPPLDWTGATEFEKRVWAALLQIPVGESRSYQHIAQSLGEPGGARAVGNACGANPILVLVPCHRVLAKGGKLGGFSSGLHWKRLLLQREGERPRELF